MGALFFANNPAGTLSGGIASGSTSFTLQSGEGAEFPAITTNQYFYVRFGTDSLNEVVKVTALSSDTFTCEATTATWTDATPVAMTISAELLGDFVQKSSAGDAVTDLELTAYRETSTSPTISSGTLTLDLSTGNVFSVELDQAVSTLTITNIPATGKACSFTLIATQDGTGGYSFTWPTSFTWPDSAAPTQVTDADSVSLYVCFTVDGGTTWYAMQAGANFGVPA